MSYSDEEVIRRVHAGNAELFHVLFERYYSRVEAFVRRGLDDPQEVTDFVSEVFVRAFRAVDQFDVDKGTPYLAYLYTIARHLIIDQHRRPAIASDDLASQLEEAAHDPTPLEEMLHREMVLRVRQCLSKLPAEHRQIIHLAYDRDLSAADIRDIMGKSSISAVTSHLHRALQRLRTIMEESGYFLDYKERGGEPWIQKTDKKQSNSGNRSS